MKALTLIHLLKLVYWPSFRKPFFSHYNHVNVHIVIVLRLYYRKKGDFNVYELAPVISIVSFSL